MASKAYQYRPSPEEGWEDLYSRVRDTVLTLNPRLADLGDDNPVLRAAIEEAVGDMIDLS